MSRKDQNQGEVAVYVHDDVRSIAQLHHDLISNFLTGGSSVLQFLDAQAQRIHQAHAEGSTVVVPHFGCWSPELVGCSPDQVLGASINLQHARETMAREFGFKDWSAVEAASGRYPDLAFERAVESVLHGEIGALGDALTEDPSLVEQRSCFAHRASLLHYLAANGVETFRQQVPLNAADVARVLLEAGSDPNAEALMYGGSAPIGLLVTSAHPAQAGVTAAVAEVLRSAGARD